MCCVVLLLALVGPRLTLLVMWLFTSYLSAVFDTFLARDMHSLLVETARDLETDRGSSSVAGEETH
jgi:hypothetical protein